MSDCHDSRRSEELFTKLKERLLAMGGLAVARTETDDLYLCELLEHGQPFALPVKPRRGWSDDCHSNAAAIWARAVTKYRLVTGYTLVAGVWRKHSWVMDEKWLYDTGAPAEQYFGVVLDSREAILFWSIHYLAARYPGPASLIMELGAEEDQEPTWHSWNQL